MKRRIFNQAALASLTASLGSPLHAEHARQNDSLIESFRHAEARHEWDWHPFVIGLGQRGRDLATRLDGVVDPDLHSLIYAESSPPTPQPRTQVERADKTLVSNAYSGVLIADLDDPNAWPLALTWAEKMQAHDVYMKAGILCAQEIDTALTHPLTQLLRQSLDTVILQPDCEADPILPGFHPALQTARLFLTEPGLICYDIADIRTILAGKIAIATSAQAMPSTLGGNPEDAVDTCHAKLQGHRIDGGIARWSTGLDSMNIHDFEAISNRYSTLLSDECTFGLVTSIDSSLPETAPGLLNMIWTVPSDT